MFCVVPKQAREGIAKISPGLQGDADAWYRLEGCTNLLEGAWESLAVVPGTTGGVMQVNALQGSLPSYYYRLIEVH